MPEARRQQGEQSSGGIFRTLLQSVGIFLLVQFVSKQFFGGQPGQTSDASKGVTVSSGSVKIPAFADRPHQLNPDAQWSAIPQSIAPMWPVGTELDIMMYISPSLAMPALASVPKEALLINEKNFKFGDWNENREISTEFKVPAAVQRNATLFAHFFVAQSGAEMDPTSPRYDHSKAYRIIRPLTQYLPKKKEVKKHNLLSKSDEETDTIVEEQTPLKTIASYYHPNLTISLIPDSGVLSFPGAHPGVRQFIPLESTGARDATGQHGWYYPIVFPNTFWQLKKHMTELNETVKTLPFNVNLNNLGNWKFSLYASMQEGQRQQAAAAETGTPTTGDGSEIEMFKEILIDSNVYLLGVTAVVSFLHMIFEMLAFKNDVAHWRKKKDNVGTSVRTIMANVVMQTIIFLYLMDNNENTSWMILFGQGMGIAIEAWKVTKSVNVRVRPSEPGSFLPYKIAFEDKHVLSETEKKTQEYDQIAFKYMYMLAVPLLIAYAIYSVLYESHKSWYSFIITTLVGSVYAYGFLMMVPSLYINYRLKSVAHMPGRAMTYKFLNTFIDDLFAFTIKMPTLHRLATLRDDVIFFVYLYQTWVYKVDYSRVNEFGQGGEDDEDEEESKEEGEKVEKPLTAEAGVEGEDKAVKASGSEKKEVKRRK